MLKKVVEDAERIAGLLNLQSEIKNRCKILLSHCKMDLSKLSNYQILDLEMTSFNLTTECNLILDKITSFSKFAPYCDSEIVELRTLREDTAAKFAAFAKNLEQAIKDGDFSEEKLKMGMGLKIHIPKFTGYDLDLDIYTFRADFGTLIEPVLQCKLWVDYLRRNCLAGVALMIIGKIENIDVIWKRLIESFGNTRIFLQNKVSALENIDGLWIALGEEKITLVLAT